MIDHRTTTRPKLGAARRTAAPRRVVRLALGLAMGSLLGACGRGQDLQGAKELITLAAFCDITRPALGSLAAPAGEIDVETAKSIMTILGPAASTLADQAPDDVRADAAKVVEVLRASAAEGADASGLTGEDFISAKNRLVAYVQQKCPSGSSEGDL